MSNNRLKSSPSRFCRERLMRLSPCRTDPKPRLAIARITLPEISWLSAVILLLHFTPHTVLIIKPQDALFSELCFQYSIFCLPKASKGRRKKEQGFSRQKEEGTRHLCRGLLKALIQRQKEDCPAIGFWHSQAPDSVKSRE